MSAVLQALPTARATPRPTPPRARRGQRVATAVVLVALAGLGAAVALWRVGDTGPLWMDAPRYANAGALAHDWFAAGSPPGVAQFARDNYRQYPAFSVPFHPPGYPAALGVAYRVFGESYLTARGFVAACWVGCGWLMYLMCRTLGTCRWGAAAAAALLLTTPELAVWSRDTMSEVPALVVILAASWLWVRWCRGGSGWWAAGAVAVALAAFFARVTTAGVLPGWAVFALVSGTLTVRRFGLAAGLGVGYLAVTAAWIAFARQYAADEVGADADPDVIGRNVRFFAACVPELAVLGTAAALAVVGWFAPRSLPATRFWLAWGVAGVAFKLAVSTTAENRHLFLVLPCLAGLAGAGLTGLRRSSQIGGVFGAAVVAVAVGANLFALTRLPDGVVGYAPAGAAVARLDRPGNLLLAVPDDQDFIFHFRAADPSHVRRCVRSDRALAVRVSGYAGRDAVPLAATPADVLDCLARGRVRYVLTFAPDAGSADPRFPEMKLASATVTGRPELFRRVGEFPLRVNYYWSPGRSDGAAGRVEVWEYLADLPPGPDELPLVIPTAGIAGD